MKVEYVVEIRMSSSEERDTDLVELLTVASAGVPTLMMNLSVDSIGITKYPEEGPSEYVETTRKPE